MHQAYAKQRKLGFVERSKFGDLDTKTENTNEFNFMTNAGIEGEMPESEIDI